jgi:hypothetical protein
MQLCLIDVSHAALVVFPLVGNEPHRMLARKYFASENKMTHIYVSVVILLKVETTSTRVCATERENVQWPKFSHSHNV